jgi:hypothetical protein
VAEPKRKGTEGCEKPKRKDGDNGGDKKGNESLPRVCPINLEKLILIIHLLVIGHVWRNSLELF